MDRVSLKHFKAKAKATVAALWASVSVLALVFWPAQDSRSGTVFSAQDQGEPIQGGPVEEFPESRFGSPPMKVDTGVTRGYAARATADLEASDEGDAQPAGGSRSPASLDFGDGSSSSRKRAAPPSRNLPDSQGGGTVEASYEPVSEQPASLVARKGVQEVALIASDLGFFPKTVFVSRDVPVRLFVTGASKNTLCIMMDSFQVRKQLRSQRIEEVTFTPTTPGRYRFYCPVNGMEGTMIVKELSTDPPSGARSIARVNARDPGGN